MDVTVSDAKAVLPRPRSDTSEESRARRHLDLLSVAASIGASLDVLTTARQLAEVLVPGLGDIAVVSLATEISEGEEPPQRTGGGDLSLRRAALAPADEAWAEGYILVGANLPPFPQPEVIQTYQDGQAFSLVGRSSITAVVNNDPTMVRALVPADGELVVACAPLVTERGPDAPGLLLGSVEVWRKGLDAPFTDDEMQVLQGIATRAAVSIDNARRYTREHALVLAQQRSLLPAVRFTGAAAQVAGRYMPAGAGAGGDWYDAIPLSSGRVALVVGDVVGHGLAATATMGRLRTAVQTLADIDLTPDELLTYLDDLVLRLAASDDPAAMGSTCLYAVYDPVDRRCAIASAGHPPPALVRPDGTVRFVDLTPGPPLGIGGLPFEVATLVLDPHSVLALYTDGLVEDHRLDIDTGMQALSDHLTGLSPGDDLEALADHLMGSGTHRSDDATLLLARVRAVDPADIAVWEVPPAPGTGQLDPAAVAGLRAFTVNRLAAWNAPPALTATAELVVSELVTNAIRYGDGRAALRLLRDGGRLVCEVHDLSTAAPHLKRGKGSSDEGGWGLFIVAQVADRWGVRYADSGKVIWTELGWS